MRVIIFSSASSREMACDELPISKARTSTATNHGSFSIRAVRISPNCSFLKISILLSMIDFLSGSRCVTLVFEGRNGIAAVGTLCKHAGLIFPEGTMKAAASALRENAIRHRCHNAQSRVWSASGNSSACRSPAVMRFMLKNSFLSPHRCATLRLLGNKRGFASTPNWRRNKPLSLRCGIDDFSDGMNRYRAAAPMKKASPPMRPLYD